MDDETTRKRLPDKGDTDQEVFCQILDIDVEASCMTEKKCCSSEFSIALLRYDDAPEFLRGNPFVVDGYRTTLPFTLCIRSLFTWSNDSVNIWTHLIGFLLFFCITVRDSLIFLFSDVSGKSVLDYGIVTTGLLCHQFCLLASTGYHLFRCHSPKAYLRWLSLDLTGILIGLLGCYLPGIHLGFYCLSVWRDVYLVVISFLFLTVLYYQTKPRYMSLSWFRYRLLLYISLAAYGVIPAVHWVYINGWESEIVQLFASKILVVYLLAVAAFAFFITQFPESCFPGKFDYVGSSHQIWHVIIVILFLWWYQSGKELAYYRLKHPCQG